LRPELSAESIILSSVWEAAILSRRSVVLGLAGSAVSAPGHGQVPTDPPSREQLFDLFVRPVGLTESYNGPELGRSLGIPALFKFPNEAKFDSILNKPRQNQIFGVDISGWTEISIPLADVRLQWVRFVYAKASQGTNYRDKKFPTFWSKLGLLKGADKPWRGVRRKPIPS
jgi:hypothetical protein